MIGIQVEDVSLLKILVCFSVMGLYGDFFFSVIDEFNYWCM